VIEKEGARCKLKHSTQIMYKEPEQRTGKCSRKNLKRGKEEVPGERKWRLSKMLGGERFE